MELEEEKGSGEMLTERVARSRDQIDQLRAELMQERSSKQDLELDKNAMERHVHTLHCNSLQIKLHKTFKNCQRFLFVAEGAEESGGRHGGSLSLLCRSLPDGKQDPRAGRPSS